MFNVMDALRTSASQANEVIDTALDQYPESVSLKDKQGIDLIMSSIVMIR